MSLFGALLTGVSALDANSRALSITSSNIANVNTVGYKTSTADFSTYLAGDGDQSGIAPASVQVNAGQQIMQQGTLTSTDNPTDLAISGNGFFVTTNNVSDPNLGTLYTRAGSFTESANGYLQNSAGLYLEGWTLNPDGSMPTNSSTLAPINLSVLNGTAEATGTMNLQANLDSTDAVVGNYTAGDMTNGTVTPEFEQTVNVYDSQGTARPIQLAFVKTGADSWSYEFSYEGNTSDIGNATNNPVAEGNITFNADGTLATPAGGNTTFTIPWASSTGLSSQSISVNFGTIGQSNGVSQFDASSALTSANVDGAPFGALSSVSVDSSGDVTALFDNGIEKKVFKIPVATFENPNGLGAVSGDAYQATETSGGATVLQAGDGGAGTIAPSSLEASTVDLATEFSNLITTQRAYSAATRIITTADQMLQELIQNAT